LLREKFGRACRSEPNYVERRVPRAFLASYRVRCPRIQSSQRKVFAAFQFSNAAYQFVICCLRNCRHRCYDARGWLRQEDNYSSSPAGSPERSRLVSSKTSDDSSRLVSNDEFFDTGPSKAR
jgi:hypothetical protein